LLGGVGEPVGLAARHVEYAKPLSLNAYLLQEFASIVQTPCGAHIAVYMVAIAYWAGDDIHPICTLFECSQDVLNVDFARAWESEKLDVGWVGQPKRTGCVGSHAATVDACESRQFRIEAVVTHCCFLDARFVRCI
jgi:hypothetical protein